MPIVDVKVMEKVLSAEQKQSIAEGSTQVFADVVVNRSARRRGSSSRM